ncbi:MAG: hypothetical protein OEV94_03415 [Deltaproteobacteria bacterium]|nr:hypothetical protein [Deltaproteobacteria bacterium]
MNRKGWKILAVMAALLFETSNLWAVPNVLLTEYYQNDIRAMAMGQAYGPLARGEGALYYNPAGLVQYDMDIKIEGSMLMGGDWVFVQDLLAAQTGGPATVLNFQTKWANKSPQGMYQYAFNGVANMAKFHWGIGAGVVDNHISQYTFSATQITPSETAVETRFASLGFDMLEGRLLVGMTYKPIRFSKGSAPATNFGGTLPPLTYTTDVTSSLDVGMIYRMEMMSALRGQWSLTMLNAGGVNLTNNASTVPQTMNFGFSFQPKFSAAEMLISAEMEDVLAQSFRYDPITLTNHKRSPFLKSHVGMELGFWRTTTGNHILNLRGGLNRGQPTYGWELNLWSTIRLGYVFYGDNQGWDKNPIVTKNTYAFAAMGLGF